MRRRTDFATTLRRGRAAARPALVVHLLPAPTGESPGATTRPPAGPDPARVGFVVSRAVGGAVTRNLVTRRLRHLVRDRLDRLPAGARVVVRAKPAAVGRSSAELGDDLDAALGRLLRQGS